MTDRQLTPAGEAIRAAAERRPTPHGLTRAVYRSGLDEELYVEVPGGLTPAADYVEDGGPTYHAGTLEPLAFIGRLGDAAIVKLVDEE